MKLTTADTLRDHAAQLAAHAAEHRAEHDRRAAEHYAAAELAAGEDAKRSAGTPFRAGGGQ